MGDETTMSLTLEERMALRDALFSAFPSPGALREAAYLAVGPDALPQLSLRQTLADSVFDLIRWAEASGRTADLIHSARRVNPGNQVLRAFEEQYLARRQPANYPGVPARVKR